jgi:hypothetical protein
VSSPGVICRNLIITGAAGKEGEPEGPVMDVCAWDLHTGKLAWAFTRSLIDKRFRAFESRTGKLLWETKLDAPGHTNPVTYLGPDGKQYVAIVSSGVNAFALE